MLVRIFCSGCVEDLIPEVARSMVANGLAEVPKPKVEPTQVEFVVPIQVNAALPAVESAAFVIPSNGMLRPAGKHSRKSRKRFVEAAMGN